MPKHVTRHKVGKRKVVEIERNFHDVHVEAGYHEQEWGDHSRDDHDLHGDHETPAGTIRVSHVDDDLHVGGPVFQIELPGGHVVNVLDADTVNRYLDHYRGETPVE